MDLGDRVARIRGLTLFPRWRDDPALLDAARASFTFGDEDRATLYACNDGEWIAPLAAAGPMLVDELERLVDEHFTIVALQAYRNGSGCAWHVDTPFGAQAILSLGSSRTFGVGGDYLPVDDGDLVYMPAPIEHCIPEEPESPGERCSLVFRTIKEN